MPSLTKDNGRASRGSLQGSGALNEEDRVGCLNILAAGSGNAEKNRRTTQGIRRAQFNSFSTPEKF